MNDNTFLGMIEQSIRRNWEKPAMTDFQGKTFYYKDFAKEIDRLHTYFKEAGIKRGDKISLAGKNSSHWAIVFFAALSYGAVVVSILHEFDKDSIEYIVNHSDSTSFFVDEAIWKNLDASSMPQLQVVFSLDDFSLLKTVSAALQEFSTNADKFFNERYKNGFFVNDVTFRTEKSEELAVINYTSGTTSSPKGVMIPYRSLWSNMLFAVDNLDFMNPGDDIVCMLPMAHTYGLAFEVLNSVSMGRHIHFLNKAPSPKILIDNFSHVKPKLVLAVPLIIEKMVLRNVFPKLKKQPIKTLLRIPGINTVIYRRIGQTLIDIFGGNLIELVIGGAALNQDVEEFLRKVKFPYTVGYGMTECGPLISYSFWKEFKQKSVGRPVDRMQVRIDSRDAENEAGEIQVKGANVMLGYYKNEKASHEMITEDGWMKTGDIGILDKDNFIFIKGRSKNLILGPSGQNIYPEEIEDKLNNYSFVNESLIVEENGKIKALIYPNEDALKEIAISKKNYFDFFDQLIRDVNAKLPVYSKINSYKLRDEEFEKTPKHSIKRFKYQS